VVAGMTHSILFLYNKKIEIEKEMTSSPLQLRPNRRITFNGLYVVGRHRRPRIFM